MKKLLIIIISLFSIVLNSQTTMECYTCTLIDDINCTSCRDKNILFTGLKVSITGKPDFLLYSPIKIYTENQIITFEDAFGVRKVFNANTINGFANTTEFFEWYKTCSCSTIDRIDSIYVTQDSIICYDVGIKTYCDTIHFAEDFDTQDLSIDSLDRVFTVYLTNGDSIKFKDTDQQTLSIDSTATTVGITLTNGNRIHFDIGEPDNDRQKIDTFRVVNTNKLQISLENDAEIYKEVTLPLSDSSKWIRTGFDVYNKHQTDSIGINTTNPGKTLDVNGEVRISDLTTGGARTLIGEIGDGTLQQVNVGHGLQLNSTDNTLRNTVRDSTGVTQLYGIIVTESPTNTYNVKLDTATLFNDMDIGWDSLYNGNRQISRVPTQGTNIQATTFREWLNWWYVASYQQPTLNFNSLASPVEVGTSTNYTLSGSTSNPCSFTLSNGTVNGNSFGSNTSFSFSYTHAPTNTTTTNITASQDWNQTGTTCEVSSPTNGTKSVTRSIGNVYPIFFFMSANEYTSGSVPYITTLDNGTSVKTPTYTDFKRIPSSSSHTNQSYIEFTGTNEYMYILFPANWNNPAFIIDHNGFNVTGSFTKYSVTVTSTGLANNWTVTYDCWKLNNLTTADNFNYTITF